MEKRNFGKVYPRIRGGNPYLEGNRPREREQKRPKNFIVRAKSAVDRRRVDTDPHIVWGGKLKRGGGQFDRAGGPRDHPW